MVKALDSWSGIRKYLEQEMLAESLRGRVRYSCTGYGRSGGQIFGIYVDDRPMKFFSWDTVGAYFRESHVMDGELASWEYKSNVWRLLHEYPAQARTEYLDGEFSAALEAYRNQDIQASVRSADPLVRMFAVLDRRVGKRTLKALRDTAAGEPEWLKAFYRLRLAAEGIEE